MRSGLLPATMEGRCAPRQRGRILRPSVLLRIGLAAYLFGCALIQRLNGFGAQIRLLSAPLSRCSDFSAALVSMGERAKDD